MQETRTPPKLAAELRQIIGRGREAWRLVPRRHKVALGAAAGVMALTSLANTSLPLLLGRLVDGIQRGVQTGQGTAAIYRTAFICLGLIGLAYLIREGFNVLRRYLVENACTRINREISIRVVAHCMKLDLATLGHEKVGALHGRILRSVDGLVRFLRLSFLDFLPALLTGLFALGAVVSKQPLLAIVMVGVIPLAVMLTVRQLMSQKDVRLDLLRSCEEIDGAVVEQLGGMEYIRAADTHALELHRLAAVTEERRRKEIRHHFEMSLFGSAKALNEGLFHILVLALAIHLAIHGIISLGDVLTFSILFLNVMAPLAEVHRVLDEGHESSLRVGDLLALLHEPVDCSFAAGKCAPVAIRPGEPLIEIEDLHVHYTTAQGQTVEALAGIALAIRQGETIGVAGRSGCGKSTWIKVLLRLVHPTAGTVRVGGVPIQQISRHEIARCIGYVGQAPFVFSGTIAENIRYGLKNVSDDDVRRAAELANLHDEIMMMPGGYDAVVTERGRNLSGGQRQRLALARILLKRPPILVLDEATSALDNISERYVQAALGVTERERTTILVAHRLTTLRDADRIVVFDNGRIAEIGKYEELIEADGVFAELVHSAEMATPPPLNGIASRHTAAPVVDGVAPVAGA